MNKHIELKRCQRISNPLECDKCHAILGSASAKCRHRKTCKGLTTLTLSVPPPPVAPQLINNIMNQQNNIIINNFGAESTSHITKDFVDKCLVNLQRGVCDYIEKVNFNLAVPENHNIRFDGDTSSVKVKEQDNVCDDLIKIRCREMEQQYHANESLMHTDDTVHFNIIRDYIKSVLGGDPKQNRQIRRFIIMLLHELDEVL